MFARFGSKVTVIEKMGQILPREDKEIADALELILKEEGIDIYTCVAEYQAGLVVANALIPFIKRKANYRVVPWVTYTDPELGRVGLTEDEARQRYKHVKVYRYDMKDLDRAVIEGEGKGMIKIVCTKKGEILGAHVLALQGGEILHEFVLAMQNNLGVKSITNTIHVYPTLSQAIRRTTNKYYAEKIFSGWIPKFTKKLIRMIG